jgi:vacuolar-type H+-ATPase subunit E/Vma4
MALADLIARLEQEAQSRVQAIREKADADVCATDEATTRAVADIAARHLDKERAERHVIQQRELAIARREAKTREMEARRASIARILTRARALLPESAAWRSYVDALPSYLDEALSFLHGLRPRVRCQAAVAPVLQAAIGQYEGAQLVIDEAVGPGIVAEAGDGSVVVDNTLAGRLARAEIGLTMALSRRLGDGRR